MNSQSQTDATNDLGETKSDRREREKRFWFPEETGFDGIVWTKAYLDFCEIYED